MGLDADTNYFALPDDAAGVSPGNADATLGLTSALDPLAQPTPPSGLDGLMALISQLGGTSAPSVAQTIAAKLALGGAAGGDTGANAGSNASANAPSAVGSGGQVGSMIGSLLPALQSLAQSGSAPPMVPPAPSTPPSAAAPPAISAPGQATAPADPDYERISSPLPASPAALPQSSPTGANVPQMPKHNDTALQIFGVLSALAGGQGGNIAGQYIQNRNAQEQQTYQQQVAAQNTKNQMLGAQADASGQFIDRLSKLDAASQESTVRNLTPSMMAAYGYTPDQVKAQFFDASGAFKPVGTDDSKQAPALLRAQGANYARFRQMTPDGQKGTLAAYQSDPQGFESYYGVPLAEATVGQTQRDATQATAVADKETDEQRTAGIQLTKVQQTALASLNAQAQPNQQAFHDSYKNNQPLWLRSYGIPYDQWKPGMKASDLNAQTKTTNQEQDAQRTDATKIALDKLNIMARDTLSQRATALATRGQNLRQQVGDAAINQRARVFQMKFGTQSKQAEQQFQQITKTQMEIMKRRTQLATPGKDPLTGAATLSPRDQGRIDAAGNVVANPVPTAAYNEDQQLAQYDQQLEAQKNALRSFGGPAPAATVQFDGGGPMRPAPITVNSNANLGNTRLPAVSRVAAPPASLGPLPSFPAFTSHGQAGTNTSARSSVPHSRLTPAQIHSMTDAQLLQHLAAKLR